MSVELASPSLLFWTEGESKLIFETVSGNPLVQDYFRERIWILLKSTIYSHTNQHTGVIEKLGEIRARGSNLFLEMLRRNNLHHAYVSVNRLGIIASRRVVSNALEIIFKKELVGTDKHSYFGLGETGLASPEGRYGCGVYIRFDWRNPNHFLRSQPTHLLNSCPYYYLIEKHIGK